MKLQWLPIPSSKGGWNEKEYNGFDRFGQVRGTVQEYIGRHGDSIVEGFTDNFDKITPVDYYLSNALKKAMLEVEKLLGDDENGE